MLWIILGEVVFNEKLSIFLVVSIPAFEKLLLVHHFVGDLIYPAFHHVDGGKSAFPNLVKFSKFPLELVWVRIFELFVPLAHNLCKSLRELLFPVTFVVVVFVG